MIPLLLNIWRRRRPAVLVALLIGAVVALLPVASPAQFSQFESFHTWTDFATIYRFSPDFRYDGDYGVRGLLTDVNWTQIYLRPSVRYRAKPWLLLHGGVALFYNFNTQVDDLPELRPHVGLRLVGPRVGQWTVTNFFRLEARNFYYKASGVWETDWRGRWQLQLTTPRFNIGSMEYFYGLGSAEAFTDIGASIPGAFGDRFRFNVGLGNQVSGSLRVELNYLFHKVRIIEQDNELDADDHVVRLRLFYTFN